MIEPTDEMVHLAVDKFLKHPELNNIGEIDTAMRETLAAVLAIVERDYPRIEVEQCGRHAKHDRHIWVNPGAYADCVCEGLR